LRRPYGLGNGRSNFIVLFWEVIIMKHWYYIIDFCGRCIKWFQAENGEEAVRIFEQANYPDGYVLAAEVVRDLGKDDEEKYGNRL
jgi:hypothetical protein